MLQPHEPAELAAGMGIWIAAVRLPARPAAATGAAITIALGAAIAVTQHPAAQAVTAATLLCLLLAVTGQFIRAGREAQDRTELLLAQLQDAREAEAAAAAVAERGRIAGELHDVLAHSLSGLAIQLQGARKLAGAEHVSPGLRAAIGRSAELAREGLADARQAVGALRGDRLPTARRDWARWSRDFRRDAMGQISFRIEGTPRAAAAGGKPALYRGAQEALTHRALRARRHYPSACAYALTVRLSPSPISQVSPARAPALPLTRSPAPALRWGRARPGRHARAPGAGGRHRPRQAGRSRAACRAGGARMTAASPPGPPIRVLIADDQRVVRDGLSMLVSLSDGITVVGSASDGKRPCGSPRPAAPTWS